MSEQRIIWKFCLKRGFGQQEVSMQLQPDLAIYDLFAAGALWHLTSSPGTKRYAEAGIRHMDRFARAHMGYTGPRL